MITPKLTAVMMAMTALIGAGPVAAFAQATNAQVIGDLTNAAVVETGGTTQVNAAETTQVADNSIEIENEAESGDAAAEGGDAESEAEAEAKSGDAINKGKKGEAESEAEAEATSIAVGGDANAESGDAAAVQTFNNVVFDNDVTQTSATVQENNLDDADVVTVTQANVPVQTQIPPEEDPVFCLTEDVEVEPGAPRVRQIACFETEELCEAYENAPAGIVVSECQRFERPPPGAVFP